MRKDETIQRVLETATPCAESADLALDRLLDRFYPADQSRSKQTAGFGVGLSIARSIAGAHKGSIQASAAGCVRFTVQLRA